MAMNPQRTTDKWKTTANLTSLSSIIGHPPMISLKLSDMNISASTLALKAATKIS
jgi:hypothetical protein